MTDGSARAGIGARVRLVATDMDGTLLTPSGTVSSRTADAVKAARHAGIHVVPATARPPQAVWDLAAAGGLGPLGVCCNGAVLVDLDHPAVVEKHTLPPDQANQIVADIKRAVDGTHFAVDDLDRFAHEPDFFEVSPDWEEQIDRVEDIHTVLDQAPIQLIVRRPGWSALELITELTPLVGERAGLTTGGLDWVHLAPPLVSKAARMDDLCIRLGIGPTEVVAIGDHHNDLPMLAWAGTSMAVANAVPEVLAVVDRTLPSNEDHGVASLLEELVERYL